MYEIVNKNIHTFKTIKECTDYMEESALIYENTPYFLQFAFVPKDKIVHTFILKKDNTWVTQNGELISMN